MQQPALHPIQSGILQGHLERGGNREGGEREGKKGREKGEVKRKVHS